MNLNHDGVVAAFQTHASLLFNASLQILPLLIPHWCWPFAPRQVTDGRDLLPFLLAPWSAPSHINPGVVLSRLIQAALFLTRIPSDFHLAAYPLWIVLALIRIQVGFVFTRSLGSMVPLLFKHWALYEETSGLGPAMVMYFHLTGVPDGIDEGPFLVLLPVLLGWLDNAPWTYSLAVIIGTGLSVIVRVTLEQNPLPTSASTAPTKPTSPSVYRVGLMSLLLLTCPYGLYNLVYSPSTTPITALDVIILSFPRAGPNSESVLTTTIASFVPHISENVSVSVFTHATFPAFTAAQAAFSDVVTFHADADEHPIEQWGHFLQLAEAFRWATGEWTMLLEDDFALCQGGWTAIEQVVGSLSPGQAGYVGAGGNGIIVHRSQLLILADLLTLHANHPVEWRRTPAEVVLDCLLGSGAMCRDILDVHGLGKGLGSGDANGGLIITSRLVLDHIGGADSIVLAENRDSKNWRCGRPHPRHGQRGVSVVVI